MFHLVIGLIVYIAEVCISNYFILMFEFMNEKYISFFIVATIFSIPTKIQLAFCSPKNSRSNRIPFIYVSGI